MRRFELRALDEEGFTLVELLVVLIILGILAVLTVPAYLHFTSKAQVSAGEANVRASIPAAESWYLDRQSNPAAPSFTGLSNAKMAMEAPGVSPNVLGLALNGGEGYCVEDTEPDGAAFSYVGGNPGSSLAAGASIGTIEPGNCATTTGVSGAS